MYCPDCITPWKDRIWMCLCQTVLHGRFRFFHLFLLFTLSSSFILCSFLIFLYFLYLCFFQLFLLCQFLIWSKPEQMLARCPDWPPPTCTCCTSLPPPPCSAPACDGPWLPSCSAGAASTAPPAAACTAPLAGCVGRRGAVVWQGTGGSWPGPTLPHSGTPRDEKKTRI